MFSGSVHPPREASKRSTLLHAPDAVARISASLLRHIVSLVPRPREPSVALFGDGGAQHHSLLNRKRAHSVPLHQLRLRADHRVFLPDCYPGGHPPKVPQLAFFHRLLPECFHHESLDWHNSGLCWHSHFHRTSSTDIWYVTAVYQEKRLGLLPPVSYCALYLRKDFLPVSLQFESVLKCYFKIQNLNLPPLLPVMNSEAKF